MVAPDHDDALAGSFHPGNHSGALAEFDLRQFSNPGACTNTSYVDRRDDIRAIIDEFLRLHNQNGSVFEGSIEVAKIGVCGHSLGGYTTMVIIGGWNSWYDPRISVALMFSPYVQSFIEHSDIGKIRIPVMYQGGTADYAITPSIRPPGGVYSRSNPPKYYVEIHQASHMDWSNLVCRGEGPVPTCILSNGKARVIDAYGIAFLDHYLNGEPPGVLGQQDPALTKYWFQETLAKTRIDTPGGERIE